MNRPIRGAIAVAVAAFALQGAFVQANYFDFGWGWGWGGADTAVGSIARGWGAFALGMGQYEYLNANAESINADTAMKWNEYIFESERTAARNQRARQARRQTNVVNAADRTFDRLRNNPEQRDIFQGDALNVVMEEINDPRIYSKTLAAANLKIGGELIRDIPFQYAAAAITTSIDQIMTSPVPAPLMAPNFEEDRTVFKTLGAEIHKSLDAGEIPDRQTIKKAIAVVVSARAHAETLFARNTPERRQVDRYLKSIHGLLDMIDSPAVGLVLSGVEKHPEATLSDLLMFMNAFNLRFGPAATPRQRAVYQTLYPMLVTLRNQIAPALAAAAPYKSSGTEAGDFFAPVDYKELEKRAPRPTAPAPAPAQADAPK